MDIYVPNTSFLQRITDKEARHQCQDTGNVEIWNDMNVDHKNGWGMFKGNVVENNHEKNINEMMPSLGQQKSFSDHEVPVDFAFYSHKQFEEKDEGNTQKGSQLAHAKEIDAFELENSIESVSKNNPYNISILDMKYERKAIVQTLGCVLQTLVDSNAEVNNFTVTKFHASRPPSISVQDYLQRINRYSSCSQEVLILALIYIDNLIKESSICLNNLNVHRILITAVMLAAKFFDDQYYNNAYYAKVGGVPREEMNALEIEFLFAIRFSLRVDPKTFNKYQTELTNHAVRHCSNCNQILRNKGCLSTKEPTTTSVANSISTPVRNSSNLLTGPYSQEEFFAPDSNSTVIDGNSLASFKQGSGSNETITYNSIAKNNLRNMQNTLANNNKQVALGLGLHRNTNSSGTLVDQYIVENNSFIRCDSYASTNSSYFETTVFDRENSNVVSTNTSEDTDRTMAQEGLYGRSNESMSAITKIGPGNFEGLQDMNVNIFNSNQENLPDHCKLLYQQSTGCNGFGVMGQTDSTSSSLTPSPSSMSSWSPSNTRSDTPATRGYSYMPCGSFPYVNCHQSDQCKGRYVANRSGQGNLFQQDQQVFVAPEHFASEKYNQTEVQIMSTRAPITGHAVSKEQVDTSWKTKKTVNSVYVEQPNWINTYPSNQNMG